MIEEQVVRLESLEAFVVRCRIWWIFEIVDAGKAGPA